MFCDTMFTTTWARVEQPTSTTGPVTDTARDAHRLWGVNAVTCFMNACRSYPELDARKLIARLFVMLAMDDRAGSIGAAFEKLAPSTDARLALLDVM